MATLPHPTILTFDSTALNRCAASRPLADDVRQETIRKCSERWARLQHAALFADQTPFGTDGTG